jgi:hypothetical protein
MSRGRRGPVFKEVASAGIRLPEGRLAVGHGKSRYADGFGFGRSAPLPAATRRGSKPAADLAGLHCGIPPGAAPDVRGAVFHVCNLQSDRKRDNDFIGWRWDAGAMQNI